MAESLLLRLLPSQVDNRNRGSRLAPWFLGPVVFIITTALIMVVIFRRQFDSDALAALADDTPTDAA